MRKLILIKHASPHVDPNIPPERWELSEQGRKSCGPLAERVRAHEPGVIVSSSEAKAEQTAGILAESLGVATRSVAGLQEHDRSRVPHMPGREFISLIELLFRRPDELVLGDETANEAADRFETVVEQVLETYPQGNIAVVSHGTVIALMLARHGAGQAFTLWRQMGLPSLAVLEVPGYQLESLTARVS